MLNYFHTLQWFKSHSITYYVCWKYFVCLIFVVLGNYKKFLTTRNSQSTVFPHLHREYHQHTSHQPLYTNNFYHMVTINTYLQWKIHKKATLYCIAPNFCGKLFSWILRLDIQLWKIFSQKIRTVCSGCGFTWHGHKHVILNIFTKFLTTQIWSYMYMVPAASHN